MTADELYAWGYALQTSSWGVTVFLETEDYRQMDMFVVHFEGPVSSAECERRGWEAAEVHFVKRRLEGKGRNDMNEDDYDIAT